MDNDSIIKTICQLENINLDGWYPITEDGEKTKSEFDKRFILDRVYFWQQNNFRKRIRFVKYSTRCNYITLNISILRISNITKSKYTDGNEVYFKGYSKDVFLKDIEKPFKLKKIMEKMGR
jgi:hypothetical protein